MKLREVFQAEEKAQICDEVLRALPAWFGIEDAIQNYVKDAASFPMIVAESESSTKELMGFISFKENTEYAAEVYVMGVLEKFHRRGLGRVLVDAVEKDLMLKKIQGLSKCEFLTVKTVSDRNPDLGYQRTRDFYLALGFRPIEEFKSLWGESNPCLLLIKAL